MKQIRGLKQLKHSSDITFVLLPETREALNKFKMETSSTSTSLESIKCILQDNIDALIPDDSSSLSTHLARLRTAIQDFQTCISKPGQDSAASKPLTYFDELPQRALENVIRHLSERPNSSEWEEFIDSRDAQSAYCGEGPLSQYFRKQFPCVQIKVSENDKPPPKPHPGPQAPPVQRSRHSLKLPLKIYSVPLSTRSWTSDAMQVLASAGSSVTSISYTGDGKQDSPPHLVSWIETFAKHCTSVKRLEIRKMSMSYFQRVVEARAGMWESLYLDSFSSTSAHLHHVSKNCIGLRELCIPIYQPVPISLWSAVGPTLEELHITLPENGSTTPQPAAGSSLSSAPLPRKFSLSEKKLIIKSIEDNCRAMRKISVNLVSKDLQSSISSLFRSYGDQLQYVGSDFQKMSSVECRNIADACPNAIFHIMTRTRLSAIEDLKFQRNAIRIIRTNLIRQTSMDFIGRNCIELRKLELCDLKWEAPYTVACLLRLPKPNLVDLHLNLDEDNSLEVLRELAMHTTMLSRFTLSLQILRSDGFRDFFEANSGLQYLRITVATKPRANSTGEAEKLVRQCARLQCLSEVIVSYTHNNWERAVQQKSREVARIANACIPLRRRRTSVIVFGIDYM